MLPRGFKLFIVFRGSEDNWIKDNKGIWIKHGNPSSTSQQVESQQKAIIDALELYSRKSQEINFSSQCIGVVGSEIKYAVDIIHVPRNAQDDLPENQCDDYKAGRVNHFIELDKEGNIIKVV